VCHISSTRALLRTLLLLLLLSLLLLVQPAVVVVVVVERLLLWLFHPRVEMWRVWWEAAAVWPYGHQQGCLAMQHEQQWSAVGPL